jgi:hypothetical protein
MATSLPPSFPFQEHSCRIQRFITSIIAYGVRSSGKTGNTARYQLLKFRFNIAIARKMIRPNMLHRVDPAALTKWLECTHIVEQHISHLPEHPGPGLMVTLPRRCGRLVINGNQRAARALRRGEEFTAFLLPERETRILLRESMGRKAADFYWQKMLQA